MTGLVFADAKAVLIDWLAAAGFDAQPRIPNPRPTEFVVVRRPGGNIDVDAVSDRAQMSIECWSGEPEASPDAAWALAGAVREHLRALPGEFAGVSLWEEDTCGELYDELSETPRVIITGTCWIQPTPA